MAGSRHRISLAVALLAAVLFLSWAGHAAARRGRGGGGDAGEDYYSILGVARDADEATIKRAYKKLAL